jgi:hypothetical protein
MPVAHGRTWTPADYAQRDARLAVLGVTRVRRGMPPQAASGPRYSQGSPNRRGTEMSSSRASQ